MIPTQVNRAGAGTRARSIAPSFYRDDGAKIGGGKIPTKAQKKFKPPSSLNRAVHEIFIPAENYHQEFYATTPTTVTAGLVIAPQLEKLEQEKVIEKKPQARPALRARPCPNYHGAQISGRDLIIKNHYLANTMAAFHPLGMATLLVLGTNGPCSTSLGPIEYFIRDLPSVRSLTPRSGNVFYRLDAQATLPQ